MESTLRTRRLLIAVLGLAALSALILWCLEEVESQRTRRALGALWYGVGCDELALLSVQASAPPTQKGDSPARDFFLCWDDWSADLRAEATRRGLTPVGTETVDNLVVTTFVVSKRLDARWFYVVPAQPPSGRPWFRVIAMDREFCLYSAWPGGRHPLIREQEEGAVDPMSVVKTICSARE